MTNVQLSGPVSVDLTARKPLAVNIAVCHSLLTQWHMMTTLRCQCVMDYVAGGCASSGRTASVSRTSCRRWVANCYFASHTPPLKAGAADIARS